MHSLVVTVLTAILAAYSAGHYLCALIFAFGRAKGRKFSSFPDTSVSVLIPSRNEGERALLAIRSAVAQDHRGPLDVYLLVRDMDDTSVPCIREAFPEMSLDGDMLRVELEGRRRIFVALVGEDPKHLKVNWITDRLESEQVAILDADHQAHPAWIRSSLIMLEEARSRNVRMVQGHRAPIHVNGLFALWDSLHQHIGCELVNTSFTRLNATVFCTGTTVLMDTEVLRKHPLRGCITEDVDLSYALVMNGERIAHNPFYGSKEELSPDVYSFLARRRRWAAGHTSAFFHHLKRFASAKLRWRDRVQFLFHGVHYLVCVLVFVLHLMIGIHFTSAMSQTSFMAAVLASLLLSGSISKTQRSEGFLAGLTELSVLTAWFAPAFILGMNLVVAFLMGDLDRASLPVSALLEALTVVGFAAPLVLLLVGLAGFRQLSLGTFLAVVLTYPIAFYLDVAGVLLGLGDWVTRRQRWRAVARAPLVPDADDDASSIPASLGIKERWTVARLFGAGEDSSPRVSRLGLILTCLAFALGVVYTPVDRIMLADVDCEVMEHDGHPWIAAPGELSDYCEPKDGHSPYTSRLGSYSVSHADGFDRVDPEYWDLLDTTFFCNNAEFSPENVELRDGGGLTMHLRADPSVEKGYSAANLATKVDSDAQFLYGRFEAELRAARAPGVITAFFLYRFDPWQEIDVEFLGRDTTKIMLNVFYNPGEEGDLYNYGYRGTPVLIDLGFDASEDFHTYAIEWDPDEIRWFADGRLIHRRPSGRPTPVPHLPMRFHVNLWPTCSEEIAGRFTGEGLPTTADVRNVSIASWDPSPLNEIRASVDALLGRDEDGSWRDEADWLQPE